MPIRKRWYADLASTFLVWVEEVPDGPPFTWRGHVLMRPTRHLPRSAPLYDSFKATSEVQAKQGVLTTIRNRPEFQTFAHRIPELEWTESELSEEEWAEKRLSFTGGW